MYRVSTFRKGYTLQVVTLLTNPPCSYDLTDSCGDCKQKKGVEDTQTVCIWFIWAPSSTHRFVTANSLLASLCRTAACTCRFWGGSAVLPFTLICAHTQHEACVTSQPNWSLSWLNLRPARVMWKRVIFSVQSLFSLKLKASHAHHKSEPDNVCIFIEPVQRFNVLKLAQRGFLKI